MVVGGEMSCKLRHGPPVARVADNARASLRRAALAEGDPGVPGRRLERRMAAPAVAGGHTEAQEVISSPADVQEPCRSRPDDPRLEAAGARR